MSTAERIAELQAAALDGACTKESLVAVLAKFTETPSTAELKDHTTVKGLENMMALLVPGAKAPKKKTELVALLLPVIAAHSPLADQSRGKKKKSALTASKASSLDALAASLGMLGGAGAGSRSAKITDPKDEKKDDDDNDDDDDDDDDDSVVTSVSASSSARGSFQQTKMLNQVLLAMGQLSEKMSALELQVAGAKPARAKSPLGADLASLLSQLSELSVASSSPTSSKLQEKQERRIAHVLLGVDVPFKDALPPSIVADKAQFKEISDLLFSLFKMNHGDLVAFVQTNDWQGVKFQSEALRWAAHAQGCLEMIALDAKCFGVLLPLLVKPVYTIYALLVYDRTGEEAVLDAVTPSLGSFLVGGSRAQFEALREAAEALKSKRANKKPYFSASKAGASKEDDEATPEVASSGKKKAASGQGSGNPS